MLGAHYLPFVFLYGMRMFAVLCGVLVSAGLLLGLYASGSFAPGAWVTAVLLLFFALMGRWLVAREDRRERRTSPNMTASLPVGDGPRRVPQVQRGDESPAPALLAGR